MSRSYAKRSTQKPIEAKYVNDQADSTTEELSCAIANAGNEPNSEDST